MRILLPSTLFVLTLSLVGCGSDDSTSTTTTDTGTSTTDTGSSSDTGSKTDTGSATDSSTTTDTGSATDSATDTATDTAPLSPTFANVYTTIISVKCTPCHTASPFSGSLDMSTKANAFTNLVGVAAAGLGCGSSGLKRVVASDPANSLLYKKVNPTPPCGSQMPAGLTPLPASDVDLIKRWIDAGAKND